MRRQLLHPIAIFLLSLCGTGYPVLSAAGEGLFSFLSNPTLTPIQQHYFNAAHSEAFSAHVAVATIDIDQVVQRQRLHLNVYQNQVLVAHRSLLKDSYARRKSWIGSLAGANGQVHLVAYKDMLTGYIHTDDRTFSIRPLTGGLHVLIEHDFTTAPDCAAGSEQPAMHQSRAEIERSIRHPDLAHLASPGLKQQLTTGECKIRYLAAYTNTVDSLLADPVSTLVGATDLANTAYANSGIGHELELCRVYHTDYDEDLSQMVDRDRFRTNGDGYMDEVHTERALWNADMCGLLRNGGSGIAYIDNSFEYAFQVTDHANIPNHTWTHEIGHNHLATHNPQAGGYPPFQGWGEPTTGCFRTIMAYSNACGSGVCSRQNLFSSNTILWNCNGSNFVPGGANYRNADRHNQSAAVLVDHYIAPDTLVYSGSFIIGNHEFASHVARSTAAYVSLDSNRFEIEIGGEAEFRSSSAIRLGRGFHAKHGSAFRAYTEICDPVNSTVDTTSILQAKWHELSRPVEPEPESEPVRIGPNPFDKSITVTLDPESAGPYFVSLSDALGITHTAQSLATTDLKTIEFNTAQLSGGTYILSVRCASFQLTKTMIKVR